MNKFVLFGKKVRAIGDMFRYFRNPLTILSLRMGIIRLPYFLYELSANGKSYTMLARPARNSMADLFVLKEVMVFEVYSEILQYIKDQPIRLIDVGGNIGSFTVWLSKYRKIAEGYIFEPLESNLNLLRFNLAANKVRNVEVMPHGLGGSTRNQKMAFKSDSPGGSSLYAEVPDDDSSVESVSVLSFGSWLDEHPGTFDILKMDCEGAEWEMMDAVGTTGFQRLNLIVAEVHAIPEDRNVADFKVFFEKAGFRTIRWDIHSHGLYVGVRE